MVDGNHHVHLNNTPLVAPLVDEEIVVENKLKHAVLI